MFSKTILLVQGCDRNAWIWRYWYEYFKRAWDFNCGIDVVMICESIKPNFKGVNYFSVYGQWSDRQKIFLWAHPEVEYIIYTVEDQMMMDIIDISEIRRLIRKMRKKDFKYILLNDDKYMHRQVLNNDRSKDQDLIRISQKHHILLWLQQCIIERKFYESLLAPNKNIWETECAAHGKIRERKIDTFMYVDKRVINCREVLRRGELKPHRMKYLWAVDAGCMFPEGDRNLDQFLTRDYYKRWKDKIKPETVLPEWVK